LNSLGLFWGMLNDELKHTLYIQSFKAVHYQKPRNGPGCLIESFRNF